KNPSEHKRPAVTPSVEGMAFCSASHSGFDDTSQRRLPSGCTDGLQSMSGQADLPVRHYPKALLLLDGDETCQHATAKSAASLSPTMNVHCRRVPPGRQPGRDGLLMNDSSAGQVLTQLLS